MPAKLQDDDRKHIPVMTRLAAGLNYLFYLVKSDRKYGFGHTGAAQQHKNMARDVGISLSTLYNYINISIDPDTGQLKDGPKNMLVCLKIIKAVGLDAHQVFYAIENSKDQQDMFNMLAGFKEGKYALVLQEVVDPELKKAC